MYQPTLARFTSRDPLPTNSVDLLSAMPDMAAVIQTGFSPRQVLDPPSSIGADLLDGEKYVANRFFCNELVSILEK